MNMRRIVALTGTVFLSALLASFAFGPRGVWNGSQARFHRWKNILTGKLVDVGGYRLRIDRLGKGSPTVVFDAGLAQLRTTWGRVPKDVAEFTQVIVYDRAGIGGSDSGVEPRTSKRIVSELHTMLKNAGVEGPYVLVGHSFGGLNARLFASQFPNEVTGIVLVDASHEDEYSRLAALMPEQQRKEYLQHEGGGNYEKVNLLASAEEIRSASPLKSLPMIVVSAPKNLAPEAGKSSAKVRDELQAALCYLSPNASQIIAEKSGHFVQLDRPELVTEAIRKVVEQARLGQGR